MNLHKYTKYFVVFSVLIIFVLAIILRLAPLRYNTPFWVDEFSTGTSARMILQQGVKIFWERPPWFESNNALTYGLTALSFALFGQSETAARIPSVLFGSLVAIAVYFLARKIHSNTVGIIAGLFTATSYCQIVWSVQARSYALLQLLILLTVWLGIKIVEKTELKVKDLLILGILCFLGMLTHFMFAFCMISVFLAIAVAHRKIFIQFTVSRWYLVLIGVIISLLTLWQIGFINSFLVYINSSFFLSNNLWYYHPFLWREYGLVVFTALLGFGLIAKTAHKPLGIIMMHIVLQLIFVTFFFSLHMSKYLLPLFPYFFIGMGVFVYEISKMVVHNVGEVRMLRDRGFTTRISAIILALGLTVFIIAQGHKFVLKPKAYYSINHDFREIANIDYNQIYSIVKKGIAESKGEKVAMIETWPGRAYWYLGEAYMPMYIYRWQDEEGLANGHSKKTDFTLNSEGEKMVGGGIVFVGEVRDLVLAIQKNTRGYLFVDDDTLPRSVIDFAEKNLKKEIFLDHYPLDDNPYSIWPATLYSWGFDK